jgi:hypothetical protein
MGWEKIWLAPAEARWMSWRLGTEAREGGKWERVRRIVVVDQRWEGTSNGWEVEEGREVSRWVILRAGKWECRWERRGGGNPKGRRIRRWSWRWPPPIVGVGVVVVARWWV